MPPLLFLYWIIILPRSVISCFVADVSFRDLLVSTSSVLGSTSMSVTVPGFLFWASNSGFQVHMTSALLTQLHQQLPWSLSKTNQVRQCAWLICQDNRSTVHCAIKDQLLCAYIRYYEFSGKEGLKGKWKIGWASYQLVWKHEHMWTPHGLWSIVWTVCGKLCRGWVCIWCLVMATGLLLARETWAEKSWKWNGIQWGQVGTIQCPWLPCTLRGCEDFGGQ